MANDVIFDIDASQILAKLHLAGIQSVSYEDKNKEFIVNTGIVDDNQSAKPDKPGNVKFDLKNSSGIYQVGYVIEIQYSRAYLTKDEAGSNMIDDFKNKFNELSSVKTQLSNDKINANTEEYKKKTDSLEKALAKLQQDIAKQYKGKVDDKDLVNIGQPLSAIQLSSFDALSKNNVSTVQNEETNDYQKAVDAAAGVAQTQLKAYMDAFAGKDNVQAIDDNSMKCIIVSNDAKDSNSKALVKSFEIQEISQQERMKAEAEFRANYSKDPKKPNCHEKLCFFVKYDLQLEK